MMKRSKQKIDEKATERLNAAITPSLKNFLPPEDLTVSEWAERHRHLSPETSAESGPWRNSRTPYLVAPMDALTDPKVKKVVVVAPSQVGKSEFELNALGYFMDQDPGSILYVVPSLKEAQKFSRLRITPMIRDSKTLKAKVTDIRVKDNGNTILQKSFPGGMLTMSGSNSADALSSAPCRIIIGDERDRWALSAGNEGDPWALAEARQTTFYDAKALEVSSPTIKGKSNIEDAFYAGTQERWSHQCPHCGAWHYYKFDQIKFNYETTTRHQSKSFKITDIYWECPTCTALSTETEMRRQPTEWIPDAPDALLENGVRSFWITGFDSPWTPWEKIIRISLDAGKNPLKLQPFFNTRLGELWEDRGETVDEDILLERREEYLAELPDGVLVLTCGVDTQDNRLEYEVVGYDMGGDSWGIKKGFIMGKPDTPAVWQQLDDVVDHVYRYGDGKGLKISVTFVDSGGHYTQDVYKACRARIHKKVFAIKGKGGDGIPYVAPATQVKIMDGDAVVGTCWLYTIGVDSGKAAIMSSIKVQEKGDGYYHFPRDTDKMTRGYDYNYFHGLLSEKLTVLRTRRGDRWAWVKLEGHERNEPLDCRNYANAGFKMIDPDMEAIERRLKGVPEPAPSPVNKPRRRKAADAYGDDW